MPILHRDQVREFDRRAIEDYHVPGVVLMENAGRGTVEVMCRMGIKGTVVICCGRGNNGGDGFVMARHLELRGHAIRIWTTCAADAYRGDAAIHGRILESSGTPVIVFSREQLEPFRADVESADWVVDALLGTGAAGEPRAPYDVLLREMNASSARKLAVDIPSGLDCDSGAAARSTFRADHTCTFVAAKPGLVAESSHAWVGQLHVVPIGAPKRLVDEFGL